MTDNCPLGLECPGEIDELFDECINMQSCKYWTDAWDLYEIFFLGEDFPPLYLNINFESHDEWTNQEYGFIYMSNLDWALYYAAKHLPFEEWAYAYYKLNRRISAYVREEHLEQIEALRKTIDHRFSSNDEQ